MNKDSFFYNRILIRVSNTEIWKSLSGINAFNINFSELENYDDTTYERENDDAQLEEEYMENAIFLSGKLKDNGVILADGYNPDCDGVSVYYINAYFGGEWKRNIIHSETRGELISGSHYICDRIEAYKFNFDDYEREVLFNLGIVSNKLKNTFRFRELHLPQFDKLLLRRTDTDESILWAENEFKGSKVQLKIIATHDSNEEIGVFSDGIQIGVLPDDEIGDLGWYMKIGQIDYHALISEIIPKSKRNKLAVSSIIIVEMKVNIIFKENVEIPQEIFEKNS